MSNPPIVETTNGKVSGAVHDGVFSFKGVPYGADTSTHRFMAPQRPKPWAGVRECLQWGALAPQRSSSAVMPSGMGAQFREFFGMADDVPRTQSEDCLVLNVFTPGIDNRKRAVMFWIHGGGFEIGGSSGSRSDGTNIAARQDVVTVSINHRLGVFGYCDLSAFSGDFARSAVAGQLDLVLALEWVRDNIANFGGDPNRVMIHGESGGGAKVSTLLGMAGARGLFTRAICQSGVAGKLPGPPQGEEVATALLKEMQLSKTDLHKLQQAPVEAVLEAAARASAGVMPMQGRGFAPAFGGRDLPIPPLEAVANGAVRDIPLIVGCTKHEATLFLAGGGMDPSTMTDDGLKNMAAMMGPDGGAIIDGYRANHPDYSPGDLLVRAMTDNMMRLPSVALAEAQTKAGGAAYAYLFTWESPVLPHLHAAHGIDGTFYFDNTETVNIAKGNAEAQTLARRASTAWANFAKDGKPPHADGLPAWPAYSLQNRETMILSGAPQIENDPLGEDREMRQRLAVA